MLLVILGDNSGQITIYNETLSPELTFQAHPSYINRIKQSPFNGLVATGADESKVNIWDPTYWTLVFSYTNHSGGLIKGVEFINSSVIATGDSNGFIKIWSICTGQTFLTITTGIEVRSLKMLGNSLYLASGHTSGLIRIYNVNNGSLIASLSGHTLNTEELILINNDLLASCSWDSKVRIWNLTTNTQVFLLSSHTAYVSGLKLILPDVLASASHDKTIKFWNITDGSLIRTLLNHTDYIQWSLDMFTDEILVSGAQDKTFKLWNVNSGEMLSSISANLLIRTLTILNTSISIGLFLYYVNKRKTLMLKNMALNLSRSPLYSQWGGFTLAPNINII